jgi:hypothetical protein
MHTFTADEFIEVDEQLLSDLPPGAIRILAKTTDGRIALEESLLRRGKQISERWSAEVPRDACGPTLELETMGIIDEQTWRAIAKIAFNYLAYIQGRTYVLQEQFDPIRDFVMGRKRDRAMVRVIAKPILRHEDYHWRAFEGHLVLFERAGYGLHGKVSLFNSLTYEIILCKDLGLLYRMYSGHALDPTNHSIEPLFNSSLTIH